MNPEELSSDPDIIKVAKYYWDLYADLDAMWDGEVKFWLCVEEPGCVGKGIPRSYTDTGDLVISSVHWLFDINSDLRHQAFFGARLTHLLTD